MTDHKSARGYFRRWSRIDRALGLSATISMCILALSVSLNVADARMQRSYTPGDHLNVPAVHVEKAPKTLVLWMDTTCHFCVDSMGFYRRLSQGSHSARIVVVGRQPKDVVSEYLKTQGVRVDDVASVVDQSTRFRGTPALALVGNDGIVRQVWLGRLTSSKDEAAVIDSIR